MQANGRVFCKHVHIIINLEYMDKIIEKQTGN